MPQSIRYDTPTISGFNGRVPVCEHNGGTATVTAAHSAWAASTTTARCNSASRTSSTTRFAAPHRATFRHGALGRRRLPVRDRSLGAVYERLRYDATPSTELKREFYGVGATVDAGPRAAVPFVGRAGRRHGQRGDGTRIGGLTKGVNTGSTQWESSYTYVLSARTLLYAGYVRIENESNAAYTFNSNTYPILCDRYPNGACGKPGGFLVGAAHFF